MGKKGDSDSTESSGSEKIKNKVSTTSGQNKKPQGLDLANNQELNITNTITIFTDGASSGNPGPSGIGVFMSHGEHKKEISESIGIATNNIAE